MTPSPSTPPVRVLLIEDNPGDAGLIRAYLAGPEGAGFAVARVERLGAGLERLAQGDIDLVLLDLSLPDSPTGETFARVRAAAPEVAVIVMSGLDDEARAVQTVQEGAQDYLVKSEVDTRLLVRSMRYAMERKRVAEALAEERELFRLLMDNIPERIFFKDAESRFTRVNRSLAGHFRAGHPGELVGHRDADYFSAEHAEAARRDEEEVMRTGMPILGKVEREQLPDGSVTWALTSKLPLLSRRGQVTGTFGISRDITELKAIEEQLASERNLLRSLIDNLPDHIHAKDTEGRYLLNNEAHRRVLGATSEEAVVGRTVFDFFPAALARSLAADDALVMTTGRPIVNREERIVDAQGRERWHATTKVPLRTPEGRVRGMVCISRDITEARQAAEALRLAHDELGRHRADLQQALAALQRSHEDLKAAQFQLIQAEKLQSIGRLAAGVAHEVKNPLAILRMGLDYLSTRAAAGDENVALVLSDMNEAIRRADAIILGLLDFAAPHALKLNLEDVGAVLEQSLGLVRHEVQAAGVTVASELGAGLPPVRLDRNKMKQVFVNLLTNACHAMPQGGTLTVRTAVRALAPGEVVHDAGSRQGERWHAGAAVLVAEVLDTGSGIAEDKLSQVFDPFYTTKAAGQGTGLGLTVTRKIVELHGGTISVCNRKEGGVAVTILLKV